MSLTDLAPVSSSISNTIRRSVTFSGAAIGHVALTALVDVVLRRLELVLDEFEHRRAGEVGDREHRLEDGLQALVRTAALRARPPSGTGRRRPSEPRSGSASPRLRGMLPKNLRTRLRPLKVRCLGHRRSLLPSWARPRRARLAYVSSRGMRGPFKTVRKPVS